jgi:5-methylcytosine-specific restriction protein A
MPTAPKHPCAERGCPALVPRGVARCPVHTATRAAHTTAERAHSQSLYNTTQWRELRRAHLQAHPLCEQCKREGRITAARVADHVRPHNGDEKKFYDPSNLQSLCDWTSPYNCHGKKTSREANIRQNTNVTSSSPGGGGQNL